MSGMKPKSKIFDGPPAPRNLIIDEKNAFKPEEPKGFLYGEHSNRNIIGSLGALTVAAVALLAFLPIFRGGIFTHRYDGGGQKDKIEAPELGDPNQNQNVTDLSTDLRGDPDALLITNSEHRERMSSIPGLGPMDRYEYRVVFEDGTEKRVKVYAQEGPKGQEGQTRSYYRELPQTPGNMKFFNEARRAYAELNPKVVHPAERSKVTEYAGVTICGSMVKVCRTFPILDESVRYIAPEAVNEINDDRNNPLTLVLIVGAIVGFAVVREWRGRSKGSSRPSVSAAAPPMPVIHVHIPSRLSVDAETLGPENEKSTVHRPAPEFTRGGEPVEEGTKQLGRELRRREAEEAARENPDWDTTDLDE